MISTEAEPAPDGQLAPARPHPQRTPLFVLAFDHRSVLRRMYAGPDTAASEVLLRQSKHVVLSGLVTALAGGLVPAGARAGLLIDEELGADAARRAHDHGLELIMPIERSGAPTFTPEYGAGFLDHLAAFPVDYAKVLIFLNPQLTGARYEGQIEHVAAVLTAAAGHGYRTMLEVIIPPTGEQLAAAGEDEERFDRELRPALVRQAITDCYAAGIRPDLWKLEGLESLADYAELTAAVHAADPVAQSLVLGRGADEHRVIKWVRLAAAAPGFSGFAIGRSIWEPALTSWLAGGLGARAAAVSIAWQYAKFAGHYHDAAALSAGPGTGKASVPSAALEPTHDAAPAGD